MMRNQPPLVTHLFIQSNKYIYNHNFIIQILISHSDLAVNTVYIVYVYITAPIETDTEVQYNIGADFCISRDDRRKYTLHCFIENRHTRETISGAFPTPDLSWIIQGDLLYQGLEDGEVQLIPEFFVDPPSRILLAPYSVFPSVLSTDRFGDIELNLRAENLTHPFSMLPPGVTLDNFRDALFETLLGEWTCRVNNTFGVVSATSTITDCAGN